MEKEDDISANLFVFDVINQMFSLIAWNSNY